ncbi:MAG: molecular chaperone DnaJ [Thermoplasmata archaeon]|jgi:molecular chaperone DnaJ|nr:molecular chaperone DnaJ [Thermoplasmata archaeon]
MAKKDYYEVLGLAKTASPDDIKSAYRRLARQYHPDVAKDNPKVAEERFKEISEAYEVLANPDTRTRYDQRGFEAVEPNFGPGGFGWQNFTHQGDLEDLLSSNPFFQQLFGNYGGSFGGGRTSRLSRGSDVEVTVRLPLTAAIHGGKPQVTVPRSDVCPDCHGNGAKDGTAIETCPECHGSGQVRRIQNRGHTQLISIGECPRCRGTGQRILERCPTCHGSGRLNSTEHIEVTVPPGMEDGGVLRVGGHGLQGDEGAPSGDLYVHVVFEPSEHIHREGETAYGEATVPLGIAVLGGEVTVDTVDGHAALKIPAGTQPETQFRLRGNGFPRLGRSVRGDLIVTVHVEIPHSLSGREKELLREALSPGAPSVGAKRESLFRRRAP